MNKKLLIALFFLLPNLAHGAWTKSSESESYILYTENSKIQVDGNLRRIWYLLDLHKAVVIDGKAFISNIVYDELDCKNKRIRHLQFNFYSGKMGSGNLIHQNDSISEWSHVVPGSTGERLGNPPLG